MSKPTGPKAPPPGKFQPNSDVPRFVPLSNGGAYFRDPATGLTRRLAANEIEVTLKEFESHPLFAQMEQEVEAIRG